MAFLQISSLTVGLSLQLDFGRPSGCLCQPLFGVSPTVEWPNQKYLRCFVSSNPDRWSQFLMWAELSYNTLQRSSTGMSPFECQFGFKPPLFPSQQASVVVPSAEVFVSRCRRVWKLAPRYGGPFRIIQRVYPVTYQLDLPRSMKVNPVFPYQ